jgi:hypothetical protein
LPLPDTPINTAIVIRDLARKPDPSCPPLDLPLGLTLWSSPGVAAEAELHRTFALPLAKRATSGQDGNNNREARP